MCPYVHLYRHSIIFSKFVRGKVCLNTFELENYYVLVKVSIYVMWQKPRAIEANTDNSIVSTYAIEQEPCSL